MLINPKRFLFKMPYPHHLQALNNVTSKPPRALYKMRVCISIHVDREAQKGQLPSAC